jgi:hypothetical protein
VKADGTDQPVAGDPEMDTLSVRITDDHTIERTGKKSGKIVYESKTTVASDGNRLTNEFIDHPRLSDKPVTGRWVYRRIGNSTPGTHAISGSWLAEKQENLSENGMIITFEQSADGLKMTSLIGEGYDAKFDGREYPYQSSLGMNKVVLKKIGPRVIEETDKFDGKVIQIVRMTVSPDDRTITIAIDDSQGGGQHKFVFVRQ